MKKRLLTLGAVAMALSVNAQTATYVGNSSKFYVAKNATVYSGGRWELDSDVDKTVENRGDIIIVGDYVKGTKATAATDGKEFLNVYTSENDYGQVKILNAKATTNAKMTMQKPAASNSYFGASYAVAFPYKDDVNYLMKSFGLPMSDFLGTCGVGVSCGTARYKMTLTKWNNDKIHHDAVPVAEKFKAGDYYNLNLREAKMQGVMTGTINYKGTPDGQAYTQTAKGVVGTEAAFSEETYNQWKVKVNPYGEKYESYMGYVDSNSKAYNKNVYRFGNPYTSNLDLSEFDGTNAWLKILNGRERTIKQAHTDRLIRDFSIRKRASNYDVDWGASKGASNVNASYHVAKFDGTKWTGSAEALLIRPLETFNLHFPSIHSANLGGTRVVNVKVAFNDNHKTFAHSPSAKTAGSTLNTTPVTLKEANRSLSLENHSADNFKQLELFLAKDNAILESPAYIVGANYYKESGSNSTDNGKIFVYGVKDGQVAYNSQKNFNEFNTESYIAKPLGVGFNGLSKGETYELGFNLYEGSIFNKVSSLSNGDFFLKDKVENKVVKIDPTKSYTFVANGDVNTRFEVYWKAVPQSSETTTVLANAKKEEKVSLETIVYKDGVQNKVRFENNKTKADIEVYNAAGGLLLSEKGISTGVDYVLHLDAQGMYVVKVVYQNGEVRTLKVINH